MTESQNLLIEKGVTIDAFHRGFVSQAAQEKSLADIDALLLGLESGEIVGSAEHGGEGSGANC